MSGRWFSDAMYKQGLLMEARKESDKERKREIRIVSRRALHKKSGWRLTFCAGYLVLVQNGQFDAKTLA
jgi:hypothetical protein